jgi:epoxyqueuosine reductase
MPAQHSPTHNPTFLAALQTHIRDWGRELGFSSIGFASVELGEAERELMAWLAAGYYGSMDYMVRHGVTRARPAELLPGTASIISARLDYLPMASEAWPNLVDPARAYVSRYALGRDYHKLMRNRLQQLGERIATETGGCQFRAFADSAPVLEVALARNAALGWRGKHTLLLDRTGSWFFLGELFVDLPFVEDTPPPAHCGTCQSCIDICPTQAILAPYRLDARRCISYLTIEHPGAIPLELRPLLGNRIYGCDDCQLVCPWNRFAQVSPLPDFSPRNRLDSASLIELFAWSEAEFLQRLEGSAIRRIGHERWLRNIAVALGNALRHACSNQPEAAPVIIAALQTRADHPSAQLREHLQWALSQSNPSHHD